MVMMMVMGRMMGKMVWVVVGVMRPACLLEDDVVDEDFPFNVDVLNSLLSHAVVEVTEVIVVHFDFIAMGCNLHVHLKGVSFAEGVPPVSLLDPPLTTLHVVPDHFPLVKPHIEVKSTPLVVGPALAQVHAESFTR